MLKTKIIILKKIIIIPVSLCVFFLAVELSARVDDYINYKAPLLKNYSAELLRTTDAEGIPINVPNIRYEKWYNNSHGFRGAPVATLKPINSKRIACMGTSETYGLYENENMEWPAQLNKMLEQNR